MSSTTKPTTTTTPRANTPPAGSMPGSPSSESIFVESTEKGPSGMPMQGINAVEVTIGNDGFNHWRAMNGDVSAPAFNTRDECVAWVTTTMIPGGTVLT